MSSSTPQAVNVDDQDPAIAYFGSWFNVGSGNAALFDNTLSSTVNASSGATFQFNGTQISVFGTVERSHTADPPPISTYKVDGADPVVYTAPNLTLAEGDGLLFFASDTLQPGPHQLVINVTRCSPDQQYYLDRLSYIPLPGAVVSQSASSSAASSSSVPSGTASATNSQASHSPPSLSPDSHSATPAVSGSHSASASSTAAGGRGLASKSSSNVGPIVGGVVGGVAILAGVIIAFLFWRRRRPVIHYDRPPQILSPEIGPVDGESGVTPYFLPQDYTRSGSLAPQRYTDGVPPSALSNTAPAMTSVSNLTAITDSSRHQVGSANGGGSASGSGDGSQRILINASDISGPNDLSSGSGTQYGYGAAGAGAGAGAPGGRYGEKAAIVMTANRPEPTVHADSGMRFDAGAREEAMSEVPTDIPPAYTQD